LNSEGENSASTAQSSWSAGGPFCQERWQGVAEKDDGIV